MISYLPKKDKQRSQKKKERKTKTNLDLDSLLQIILHSNVRCLWILSHHWFSKQWLNPLNNVLAAPLSVTYKNTCYYCKANWASVHMNMNFSWNMKMFQMPWVTNKFYSLNTEKICCEKKIFTNYFIQCIIKKVPHQECAIRRLKHFCYCSFV